MPSLAKPLFTYWDGPEYPVLRVLRVILELYADDGGAASATGAASAAGEGGARYQHINLNSANLAHYLGDELHPNFRNILKYQARSDYARIEAVYKYGGGYLDSDIVLLREPREILAPPGGTGFMPDRFYNAAFLAPPQAPFLGKLREAARRTLSAAYGSPYMGEEDRALGPQLWRQTEKDFPQLFKGYHRVDYDAINPVDWRDAKHEFILKPYHHGKEILSRMSSASDTPSAHPHSPFFNIYGGGYVPLREYSEDEVLASDHPLAFLLNTALDNAERAGYDLPVSSRAWAKPGLAAERLAAMEGAPRRNPQYELALAAEQGDYKEAKRLLRKTPAQDCHKARYAHGVLRAVFRGDLKMLRLLVERRGLDLNRIIDYSASDLQNAWSGGNLLHTAVMCRQAEILDYLLRRTNLRVNQRNDYQLTPLQLAALQSKRDAVKRLLRHPAVDLDAKYQGKTARDMAAAVMAL